MTGLDAASLRTLWQYRCAGRVNALAAGDLDGAGRVSLLQPRSGAGPGPE